MGVVRFDRIARECRETHKGGFEGIPIVGLEHIEPYEMRLKNYDINVETTFTKRFHKGQILFGRRRAYQHKACVATCDGICSGDITVIEPIEGQVYPGLLPFIIQNDDFFEHAIKGSNGALSPRVKWEHMANYEVNLPPFAEQKLLAEKLWAAYEVKQSYLKMIKATQEMVQSQFIVEFGTIDMPKVEVKELLDVVCEPGQYGSNTSATNYVEGTPRYIRITDIDDDGSLNEDLKSAEFYDDKFILKKDDIVFARTGATVGKTYLHEEGEAIYAGYLIKYHPKESIIRPRYLKAYTHSSTYYNWVNKTQKIGAQPNISAAQYDKMPVLVPSLDGQDEYLKIYNQADKSEFGGSKSQFIEMFGATTTTVQIKDVCFVVSGKSIPTKLEDIQGNVPYIKVADFNLPGNEKYIASALRYVAKESSEYSKMIPVGSVVFAKNGAASLSNKKRLTKIECCIDMNTMAIIPRSSEIMPEFLFAIIQAMDVSAHVRQGAIPSISPKSIEDYGIVLPSTEEQNKYVTIVQQADKSEKCCEIRLAS